MPFTVQFNHTAGVGYHIIVELYGKTLDVPRGFPADSIFDGCLGDASIEFKEDGEDLTPLDRRCWQTFSGYDDGALPVLLQFILRKLLHYEEEDARAMVVDMQLELALSELGLASDVFDEVDDEADLPPDPLS